MNPSRPAAPRRLDTRAESPMGDDDLPVPNGSPVHRNTPHGLPTPSNDAPSSGFTAVNGDSHRTSSFRPGDTAHPLVTMPSSDTRSSTGPDPASASSTYNPHNWRPDERHAQPDSTRPRHDTHSATKRKRADSANIEHRSDVGDDQADSASNSPPKRRATAFDSPERTRQPRSYSVDRHELPPPATGPYVREPSPVYRTPRAEPLPPPRPEAEAALAASLQQTLDAEQQAQVAVPESESPSNDMYEQEESQHYGAEQHGDSSDPKPRKRNFSNRTKTGCHTCRARKKKCDEGKPTCENCKRGSFECGGYGPKPPGGMKISAARNVMPIQSKQPYEQHPHGHPPFYEPSHYHNGDRRVPPPWDYSRPDAYAASHPPPQQHRYAPQPGPMDPHNRPSSGRDSWARPPWGAHEQPPSTYLSEHLPPVDYSNVPPVHTYPPERLMHPDSWGPPPPTSHYRRSIPLPPQSTSSRGSGLSIRSMPNSIIAPAGQKTEKNKMMSGQPYKHYTDDELVRDRTSCNRAVEAYNNACTPSSTLLPLEKERHFTSILDPRARNFSDILGQHWPGPVGTCGARTIVEAPFTCELGYNIHLGNEVLVAANCHMQDACPIMIGDRTIVGPNVKFYGVTTSVDPTLRTGSKGNFYAGPIRIEEDVYIGADAIILPYRTVGKGATVGAGAVVTRDVKPYTVVGGNPAKPIRKHRIESGRNVDRHDDAIEAENQKMLDWLKNGFAADLQRKLQNDRKL